MNELQATIKITQTLHDNGCTYNEVNKFLDSIKQHYKEIRERREYETANDFVNGNKRTDVGNLVVDKLNDIII